MCNWFAMSGLSLNQEVKKMNWQEKLQALDKSKTREERDLCESEIVLNFMQTEVFTRLDQLRVELVQQGLTVTLNPNCADDIRLLDYEQSDDIEQSDNDDDAIKQPEPDTLVEISVNKNGETVIHTAKFKGYKTSLTIKSEVPKSQFGFKGMTTTFIVSPNSVLLVENNLRDFRNIFLKK